MAYVGNRIADFIEKRSDNLASGIRDALDSASWLPDALRPPRSGSPSHIFYKAPPPPKGLVDRTTAWISENRTYLAIGLAFASTTFLLVHRRKKAHARKRRAKKFSNGAKKEIVVLACSSFHDPLTKSLAIDLERRGYIVFVTVSSSEEDSLVRSEAKPDVRSLWMDLTSSVPNPEVDIHPNLEYIREMISYTSNTLSSGSMKPPPFVHSERNYSLAGVVVLPGSSGYPAGPFLTIPPSDLVDTLNTRLISTVVTVQQFLPLLTNHSSSSSPATIILAYPSIPLSLSSPLQTPEILITSSLSAFTCSLRHELQQQSADVRVTELKLGNFDFGNTPSKRSRSQDDPDHVYPRDVESQASALTAPSHWHSSQRAARQRSSSGQSSIIKGRPVRDFHNAVFDALAPPITFKAFGVLPWTVGNRKPRTVYVGSGAKLYDAVGRMAPGGLVAWMMGYRERRNADAEDLKENQSAAASRKWGASSSSSESGVWEKV